MKTTAINLKTGESCANPLDGIKTFVIPSNLYTTLNVTAEQGTLGIHNGYPVAYMPIDLLFRNIKSCKICPTYDGGLRIYVIFGRGARYETLKIFHCKLQDSTLLLSYIETKRVGYPHSLTIEQAERIKPFKWNLGTLLTIEKTEL